MIVLPLVVSALLLGGTAEEVARVNGVALSQDDVTRRIAASGAAGRPISPREAVEGLVVEALLAQEGRRLGLASSPAVRDRVDAWVRRAAAQALVESFGTGAEPPESDLRQAFHATADQVRFESLTFETRGQAEEALRRIRKGSTLAAEAPRAVTSRLAAAPEGVPPIIRGELPPALAEGVFSAKPGQTVGPFEYGPGWTIARPVSATIGSEPEFAKRRASLVQFVRAQASAQARRHVVEMLRARASVSLDEAFLRGLQGTEATPAQLDTVIATVNGRPVLYRDIYASVRSLGAGGGHMANAAVKIQLAQQEIENRLLQDASVQRGFDRRPEVTARRSEFERSALALALVERIRASTAPPSEEEIEAFYRENSARFGRPFRAALPEAARGAAEQKKAKAVARAIEDLRRKGTVSIDPQALARVGSP